MKIYEFLKSTSEKQIFSSRFSLSFYFFLFFIGFVLGNLFPILCTTIEVFGRLIHIGFLIFQNFLKNILLIARNLFIPCQKIFFRFEPIQSLIQYQKSLATNTPLSKDFESDAISFADLKIHRIQQNQTVDKPIRTNKTLTVQPDLLFEHQSFAPNRFDTPNIVSALLLVLLYEVFSIVEKVIANKILQIKTASSSERSFRMMVFQSTPKTLIRILRTVKVGFFLGIFVDAFKVGS